MKKHHNGRSKYSYVTKINTWVDGELEVITKGFGDLEDAIKHAKENNVGQTVRVYHLWSNELVHQEAAVTVTDTYA